MEKMKVQILKKSILKAKMPKEVQKMYVRIKKIKKYEPNVSRSYSCKKLFRLDDRFPWSKKDKDEILI